MHQLPSVFSLLHRRPVVGYAAVGVLFFLLYSWPVWRHPAVFTSPDETANYVFTQNVRSGNGLAIAEPLNGRTALTIAPRSTSVVSETIVPGSFSGLILIYGMFARVIGMQAVFFLLPLFTVFALFALYDLFRRLVPKHTALLASFLAAVHPAVWLYTGRPFYHTMLFIDLLILSIWMFVLACRRKRLWMFGVAGLLASLALLTRTSEVVWLIPLFVFLAVFLRASLHRKHLVVFFGVLAVSLAYILFLNRSLYGGWLTIGYVADNSSAAVVDSLLERLLYFVLPFGFSPERAGTYALDYLITIFPFYGLLSVFGVGLFLHSVVQRSVSFVQRWYGFLGIGLVCWLVAYYGSGLVGEIPENGDIVLSASYIRYWLPLYLWSMPFVAQAILSVGQWFRLSAFSRFLPAILFLLIVISSFQIVMLDADHGFLAVRQRLEESRAKQRVFARVLPQNALVVAGAADKLFFPAYRVIVELPNTSETVRASMKALSPDVSWYFYDVTLDPLSRANRERLNAAGIALNPVSTVAVGETLYQLQP